MQLTPDWRKTYTPEEFEADLQIPFRGPGFYLSETDTLVVIPLPPKEAATKENVWAVQQPPSTLYECNVYNCNFRYTVFAAVAAAPVRSGDRTLVR